MRILRQTTFLIWTWSVAPLAHSWGIQSARQHQCHQAFRPPRSLLLHSREQKVTPCSRHIQRLYSSYDASYHGGDDDEDDTATNPLILAGEHFKQIDDNVGQAVIRAGVAWTSDWSYVAEALDEAAHAFWDVLSKRNISPRLAEICRSVAQELEDISTIEGCSSIGPASSLPNWINIHNHLQTAARSYAESEDEQHIYETLQKTSLEIEKLIESI